jgi:hypothetical protein
MNRFWAGMRWNWSIYFGSQSSWASRSIHWGHEEEKEVRFALRLIEKSLFCVYRLCPKVLELDGDLDSSPLVRYIHV